MSELDIRGILGEFVQAGVDFLVRLAEVLKRLDAEVEGAEEFADDELPDPLDPNALALGGNWVLRTRLGRLDIMQWIGDDALWEKLSPASIEDEIGGLSIKMVGYRDLLALKERAGRPEDLIDLERLRQIRGDE